MLKMVSKTEEKIGLVQVQIKGNLIHTLDNFFPVILLTADRNSPQFPH